MAGVVYGILLVLLLGNPIVAMVKRNEFQRNTIGIHILDTKEDLSERNHYEEIISVQPSERKENLELDQFDPFSEEDHSKRKISSNVEDESNLSYETDLHPSDLFSFLSKKRKKDSKTEAIIHEEGLKNNFPDSTQDVNPTRENIVTKDLRNDDKENDKDTEAMQATSYLIWTKATATSAQMKSTYVGVESEKSSRGERMKNHWTYNHPIPSTIAQGSPQKLYSIGTRLNQEKNLKKLADSPISTLLHTKSLKEQLSTFPYRIPFHDVKDDAYFTPKTFNTLDLKTDKEDSVVTASIEKEIRRMKRNSGDQFTKEFPSQYYSNGMVESKDRNLRESLADQARGPTPAETMERLKHLVDKIVRELSQFKQKFTLRLIRMTERDDLNKLPEIMKDFQISPERPIFFIAGGLKALPIEATTTATEIPPTTTSKVEDFTTSTHATEIVFPTSTIAPDVETTDTTTRIPLSALLPQVLNALFQTKTEISVSNDTEVNTEMEPTTSTSASLIPTLLSKIDSSTTPFSPVELTTSYSSTTNDSFLIPTTEPTTELTTHSQSEEFNQKGETNPPMEVNTRKKRSYQDYEELEFSSRLFSSPGRMARTENPFEDNEPLEYYPLPYYELRLWPYPDMIRQSHVTLQDDDSKLTDVGESLLSPILSSPTQYEIVSANPETFSNSQFSSLKVNSQEKLEINLHQINLTSPSTAQVALNKNDNPVLSESRIFQSLQPSLIVIENDNENISPSSILKTSGGSTDYDKEIWTQQAQSKEIADSTSTSKSVENIYKHTRMLQIDADSKSKKSKDVSIHSTDDKGAKNETFIHLTNGLATSQVVNEHEKYRAIFSEKMGISNLSKDLDLTKASEINSTKSTISSTNLSTTLNEGLIKQVKPVKMNFNDKEKTNDTNQTEPEIFKPVILSVFNQSFSGSAFSNERDSAEKIINDAVVNQPEQVSDLFDKSTNAPETLAVTEAAYIMTSDSETVASLNNSVSTSSGKNETKTTELLENTPKENNKSQDKANTTGLIIKIENIQESTSVKPEAPYDKPLDFKVEISTPILDAATSIIKNIFGFEFDNSNKKVSSKDNSSFSLSNKTTESVVSHKEGDLLSQQHSILEIHKPITLSTNTSSPSVENVLRREMSNGFKESQLIMDGEQAEDKALVNAVGISNNKGLEKNSTPTSKEKFHINQPHLTQSLPSGSHSKERPAMTESVNSDVYSLSHNAKFKMHIGSDDISKDSIATQIQSLTSATKILNKEMTQVHLVEAKFDPNSFGSKTSLGDSLPLSSISEKNLIDSSSATQSQGILFISTPIKSENSTASDLIDEIKPNDLKDPIPQNSNQNPFPVDQPNLTGIDIPSASIRPEIGILDYIEKTMISSLPDISTRQPVVVDGLAGTSPASIDSNRNRQQYLMQLYFPNL